MPDTAELLHNTIAFPILDATDLAALAPLASSCTYRDGEIVFRAGDADLDLFVVETGAMDIVNPSDGNRLVVTHGPGQFAGDIDLLTRRPVIVTGIARGATRLMRVPGSRLREVLNKMSWLGEKMLIAAQERRRLLSAAGVLGMKVVGPGKCRDTMLVREFLFKNFVPFTWYESGSERGLELMTAWGSPKKSPVIEMGGGRLLINPGLRELAQAAGVWRHCPGDLVDLAVVGAGPAGMTAAVYAASEGLSTVVVDRLGPGGQAAGSSKIENFIGFPAGLSGAELATRGVLQMLKFGARMVSPVAVDRIEVPADPREPRLLHLDCDTTVRARVVLVATGVGWRKLPAVGAERFESAGIHYVCTAVEAVLYDECDVIVVGGGNSAGQAAMHLAECCRTRRVHLVVRSPLGSAMSEYLVSRIRGAENITVHEGTEVAEVEGGHHLEYAVLEHKSGVRERLRCSGVFVFIGADPAAGWLPPELARDDLGYILTGSDALRSGRWPLTHRDPCPLLWGRFSS